MFCVQNGFRLLSIKRCNIQKSFFLLNVLSCLETKFFYSRTQPKFSKCLWNNWSGLKRTKYNSEKTKYFLTSIKQKFHKKKLKTLNCFYLHEEYNFMYKTMLQSKPMLWTVCNASYIFIACLLIDMLKFL